MVEIVKNFQKWSKMVQKCLKMVQSRLRVKKVQKGPKGPKQSKMVQNDPKLSTLVTTVLCIKVIATF